MYELQFRSFDFLKTFAKSGDTMSKMTQQLKKASYYNYIR